MGPVLHEALGSSWVFDLSDGHELVAVLAVEVCSLASSKVDTHPSRHEDNVLAKADILDSRMQRFPRSGPVWLGVSRGTVEV